MENKSFCIECYKNQLKYCEICKKSFIGYENHLKLHKARNSKEQTGSLIADIINVISAPVSQDCKYCKKTVDETKYYFSIKKCKDCHKQYKKEKVNCEKCNNSYKRSSFFKHHCKG